MARGHQLLARPRLAADEHRRARRREHADELVDLDHLRRAAHAGVHPLRRGRALGDGAAAAAGGAVAQAAVHHQLQLVQVHRLDQVVVRPVADGVDGGAHVLVAGDDDHVHLRHPLVDGVQQLQPAHPAHLHVREHHVGAVLVQHPQRLLGAGGGAHLEVGAHEVEFQRDQHGGIVVDQQKLSAHGGIRGGGVRDRAHGAVRARARRKGRTAAPDGGSPRAAWVFRIFGRAAYPVAPQRNVAFATVRCKGYVRGAIR